MAYTCAFSSEYFSRPGAKRIGLVESEAASLSSSSASLLLRNANIAHGADICIF